MEIRYTWLQNYDIVKDTSNPSIYLQAIIVADLLTKTLPLCKVKREGLTNHFNVLCDQMFSGDIPK